MSKSRAASEREREEKEEREERGMAREGRGKSVWRRIEREREVHDTGK